MDRVMQGDGTHGGAENNILPVLSVCTPLSAVPFGGPANELLKSLWQLAARRHRWEMWENASQKLSKSMHDGVFTDLSHVVELLRIWAVADAKSRDSTFSGTLWCAAGADLKTEVLARLNVARTNELSMADLNTLCDACQRLQLRPPRNILVDFANQVLAMKNVDETFVINSLAALRSFEHQAPNVSEALSRTVCSILRGATLNQRWLRPLLLHIVPYTPIRTSSQREIHTLVLRMAARALTSSIDSLNGFTRALLYWRHCCGPPAQTPAFWDVGRLLWLRLVMSFLDQESGKLATVAERSVQTQRSTQGGANLRGMLSEKSYSSSALEKDVKRVVLATLRRAGAETSLENLRGRVVLSGSFVPPLFQVDLLLLPVAPELGGRPPLE